jgi:hypothetical protein
MATLIERLDQHRGRGQQQITVKHVNVNADQAVVTETVATQRGVKHLYDHRPHAKRPQRAPLQSYVEANGKPL